MDIRPLQKSDYTQWLPLWTENCLNQIDPKVTAQTWKRLCDKNSPVHGFGAFIEDELTGIVHYILHPITGNLYPACYMQDVFVAQHHRQKGIAKTMIQRLALEGRDQNWARLYWLAEESNDAAQRLYKSLGIKLNFSLHVYPLTGQ